MSFVFSASPEFFFDFKKSKMNIDKWNSMDISNSEKDKRKIAEVWKTLNEEKVKEAFNPANWSVVANITAKINEVKKYESNNNNGKSTKKWEWRNNGK